MRMNRLFLDTSFAIALASHRDQHHVQAVAVATDIRATNAALVTTIPVVVEIGNALAKQSFREAAVHLISSLHSDPSVTIVPLDHSLYNRA